MTLCRHCGRREATQSRGLCWRCYYNPDVREQYPSAVIRGVEDVCGGYASPDAPTDATPGTPDKIAVLTARAAQGCALWHGQDGEADE